jgi:enterochelin esterase-like enzyme
MRQFFWLAVLLLLPVGVQSQSTASTQVTVFTLEAPQLQGQKKIWLYLPKDYATTSKKYPVLYMHDGQNLFDAKTSYVGEWNVDETLDSLNAQVIVVGIEHGNDKRIDELTPYKNEKYGGGKADVYLNFIVNTLKPYIDQKYRTKTNYDHGQFLGRTGVALCNFEIPESFWEGRGFLAFVLVHQRHIRFGQSNTRNQG